ncbi:hypothetical protein LXA43DRAFT_482458 [Ganoderma leucocontextum]|nr:hypothetical protein LXA43DRAFT_482458 [Ganoderma leucocontextum]
MNGLGHLCTAPRHLRVVMFSILNRSSALYVALASAVVMTALYSPRILQYGITNLFKTYSSTDLGAAWIAVAKLPCAMNTFNVVSNEAMDQQATTVQVTPSYWLLLDPVTAVAVDEALFSLSEPGWQATCWPMTVRSCLTSRRALSSITAVGARSTRRIMATGRRGEEEQHESAEDRPKHSTDAEPRDPSS